MTEKEKEEALVDVTGLSVSEVETMMGYIDAAIVDGTVKTNFDVLKFISAQTWTIEQKVFAGMAYGGYYTRQMTEPPEDLRKVTFH